MPSEPNTLIATLVDDLRPVRAMRTRDGVALAASAGSVTLALTILLLGLRPDVAQGQFQPLFLFANGVLLIVGLGSALAAVRMGMPRVGQSGRGWKWMVALISLLPATALIMLGSGTEPMPATLVTSHELECVAMGLALSLLTATALIWWLRRGAPTSTKRAGLLVGVSSSGIGMFAFAFHCPYDSFYHVGLWHVLQIAVGAMLGRLLVSRLVRW